jgi:predicted ATPase
VRLVTVTGPAGVGKTRLAVQVIEDIGGTFDDGTCFVELADLRDPDKVPVVIAEALSLREATGHSPADRLLAHLPGKHLLLVLDNFEHLAPAAALVARLLAVGPQLKVLVTSRARLRLRAEHEFVVTPLPLPDTGASRNTDDAEQLLRYAAIELFVQRARAAGTNFTLAPANATSVVEICRRLDGLPLAIELAASRTKVLPVSTLLERLQRRLPILTCGAPDLPERLRTMRTAIDWSYELLNPTAQAVFRRLASFVGGCSLEAAQAIAGADLSSSDEFLECVAVLVDHSLVNVREDARGEPRISLLEVIREYGLERLANSLDLEQVRERHAEYCLQLAEAASAHLIGSQQQSAWLQQLDQERGNMLAALEWARERAAYELGVRLVAALGPFWYFRGYFSEGRQWIDTFLGATAIAASSDPSRIWLLYGAGKLAIEQGDYPRVREVADEALALAQDLGNALGMSQALELQGTVACLEGDAHGGRALLEQALHCGRRAGDRGQLERVLFGLGHAARDLGDSARAELAFEELLVSSREDGPLHGTARVLLGLGQVALERVDDERAAMRYREALEVFAKLGDPSGLAACHEGLAALAHRGGDLQRTARLAGAARKLRDAATSSPTPAERQAIDDDIAAARATLGEAAFAAAWSEGGSLTVDAGIAYAMESEP